MPSYLIQLISTADVETSFTSWGKGHVAREMERVLNGLSAGVHSGSIDVQRDPAGAVGVLTLSGGAGAVGGTIGGKTVTATWAGTDLASAALIAAAINADTTANKFVSASSCAATGTITIASGSGAITVTITAPAEVAGKNEPTTYSVTWATSDTATAAALAAAINADGSSPVVAIASSGVVTLVARTTGANGNLIALAVTGTGVTKSGVLMTGGTTNANVIITALSPGTVGLGISLVASGTGVTATSGANLVAGVGAPGNTFTV
jgi:phage tail sheath gpL-like